MRTVTVQRPYMSRSGPTASAEMTSASNPIVATLLAMVVAIAVLACQALMGGTRLLFAFPAYAIVALMGVLTLLGFRSVHSGPNRATLIGTWLFAFYILARAFFSPSPYLARFDIYSLLAGLIVYLVTALVLTDGKKRMIVVAVLLAGAVVQVVVGAIQFRNGDNWMPIGFLQRFDYGRRASGFYFSPNHLAGMLEVVGVFGLSLTFFSRWPVWGKLLTGYAAAICYIGVILTGSRGGYLSALFGLFVFALLSLRIIRASGSALHLRLTIVAVILLALATIGAFLIIQNSDYLANRESKVADKDIRLDYWRAGLQQFQLSPILGTGSRTYLYYGRLFRSESMQMDPFYVHNDYLQLLAEYGVIGGVLFLVFFLFHLRWGLISARRLGPRRIASSQRILSNNMALNVGALSAVGAYVVHSFFDFNLHIPANLLLLAFVFGILANNGVPEEPTARSHSAILSSLLALCLISLFLGVQIVRLWPGEWYTEQTRIALRDQRLPASISAGLKALQFQKRNPEPFYYLGRARYLSADRQPPGPARSAFYAAAVTDYETARQIDPSDETYAIELGFLFDAMERFSEAEWLFDEARRLDPRSGALQRYYEEHLRSWSGNSNARRSLPPQPEPPA